MPTLGEAVSRILNDLNRADSATGARVREAIAESIVFYSATRFAFNQVAAFTASWSVSAAQALPPGWVATDGLRLLTASWREPLTERTSRWLDAQDCARAGSVRGFPTDYAIEARAVRVFPYPNSSYPVEWRYLKKFTEVSASASDATTNVWLTDEAWPLIRAHAMGDVLENFIQGDESQARSDRLKVREGAIFEQMRRQAGIEQGCGIIQPSL